MDGARARSIDLLLPLERKASKSGDTGFNLLVHGDLSFFQRVEVENCLLSPASAAFVGPLDGLLFAGALRAGK